MMAARAVATRACAHSIFRALSSTTTTHLPTPEQIADYQQQGFSLDKRPDIHPDLVPRLLHILQGEKLSVMGRATSLHFEMKPTLDLPPDLNRLLRAVVEPVARALLFYMHAYDFPQAPPNFVSLDFRAPLMVCDDGDFLTEFIESLHQDRGPASMVTLHCETQTSTTMFAYATPQYAYPVGYRYFDQIAYLNNEHVPNQCAIASCLSRYGQDIYYRESPIHAWTIISSEDDRYIQHFENLKNALKSGPVGLFHAVQGQTPGRVSMALYPT